MGGPTTYISDINRNPTNYLNTRVHLSGRVQNSKPAGPATPGSFVLVDDSFETITIITYDPPAPGSKISLYGIVKIDTSTQMPYIVNPMVVGTIPILAIIAALVVLALIIVLVIILKKPAQQPQLATASAAPAAARPRTEKVSETEAKAIAGRGRPRTDKVPAKPAQLEVLNGDRKGDEILLVMENVIGRDEGNIRFPSDRGVSGEHARIKYVGGRYYITNVSLTNPLKVNGKEVGEEYELKEKDEILLGTVKVRFKYTT